MGRIPEEEIERLKREVSLERLAQARGVALKRHGSDLIGLCPWHPDKEPSLVITPAKNLWHCLGACQAGGSVIDWVMRAEGISFRHAVELLREVSGQWPVVSGQQSAVRTGAGVVKNSTVRKLECPLEAEAEDRELLKQVVDYYHETLKQSPDALAYLERRGLNNAEMIERFRLGYANRSLGYRLPASDRAAGAKIRSRLQELGVLRESGHEHFNGSIIIPVFGEQGAVTEIYGRKIGERLRQGTPLHLYLPGPHRGVWNIEALQSSKEIILCESLIDALTFWCAGYPNVTASYGVEGFTAAHWAAFKQYNVERVLNAYDRDQAGEKAAQALAEKLIAEGIACYRIQFPKGMDANEYALKVKPAEKSLGLLIRSAEWLGGKERRGDTETRGRGEAVPGAVATGLESSDECGTMNDEREESTAAAIAADAQLPSGSPAPGALKAEGLYSLAATAVDTHTTGAGETPALPELFSLAAEACDPEPPVASPLPASPVGPLSKIEAQLRGEDIHIEMGDRSYRVRGLARNMSSGQMKVNVTVTRGEEFHMDTLDLCADNGRRMFIKVAAIEIGADEETIKRDIKRVLNKLEQLQDEQIRRMVAPKEKQVEMSREEQAEALELLGSPRLWERIAEDLERCGIVGEQVNKIAGYYAAVSRKLEKPLAVIIQSSSAAGKSSLMEAILSLMPEEETVKYSAMTGQSLFYMEGADLKHKILAIAEEEGAQRASYALKLLQSEGELTIASTGKDPATGRLVTHEYKVEGPVMIFSTTTAIEIDEELLNRCVVLTVDEEREQTRAIHRLQRQMQTLDGLWAKEERKRLRALHQNAQRLLKPLEVVNPYANDLTFLDDKTRTRRDHTKYLTLILSIALLGQYQREVKTVSCYGETKQYIEVTIEDIELANRLANEVLGRSLDELLPQTRKLLELLDRMVAEASERLKLERSEHRFSRREVREYTGWNDTQLRLHLGRLVDMEYVLVHRGSRGQSFVYELLYDGQGKDGSTFVMGLIDVEHLRRNPATMQSSRGEVVEFAGSTRGQSGGIAGGSRGQRKREMINNDGLVFNRAHS